MSEQWNGEGLPPVGTVCLSRIAYVCRCEVEIMARSAGYVWVRKIGALNNCHAVWVESEVEYTPIRSAEEVAVEAMREAVISDNGKPSRRQVCRDIYAAIRDGKIPGVKLEEDV